MQTSVDTNPNGPSRALRIGLWAAQAFVFAAFVAIGTIKLFTPMASLESIVPWAGQFPEAFVRGIGVIDIAGGAGVLLPALTRIRPALTVLAALGCMILQIFAIAFHLFRGEASITPANFRLLTLASFIFWGRRRQALVLPR